MSFRGEIAPHPHLGKHVHDRRQETRELAQKQWEQRIVPPVTVQFAITLENERDQVLAEAGKPPPPLEPPPLLHEIEKVVFGGIEPALKDQLVDVEAIANEFPLFAAARITIDKRKK